MRFAYPGADRRFPWHDTARRRTRASEARRLAKTRSTRTWRRFQDSRRRPDNRNRRNPSAENASTGRSFWAAKPWMRSGKRPNAVDSTACASSVAPPCSRRRRSASSASSAWRSAVSVSAPTNAGLGRHQTGGGDLALPDRLGARQHRPHRQPGQRRHHRCAAAHPEAAHPRLAPLLPLFDFAPGQAVQVGQQLEPGGLVGAPGRGAAWRRRSPGSRWPAASP